MNSPDAPQWLIGEWARTCQDAGATADEAEIRAVGERLIDRWMQPGRHFHNIRHLTDVLARVDELERETHEPQLVRLAAWYHGAIFDADEETSYAQRGGEDELASAALARAELTDLGLPAPGPDRVAELVIALRRHAPAPDDVDCAVLCDADLAMLAGDPQRYKTYLAEVRAEYAHLPVEEFVRARIAILRKLDQRESLFRTPLGAAWEEPARQNVQAELHRLEKELAALEQRSADEHEGRPTAPEQDASPDDVPGRDAGGPGPAVERGGSGGGTPGTDRPAATPSVRI